MTPVGRHSGGHAAATTPRPARRRLLMLSFFVTVALVAWGVLVVAAIDFGREARSGDGEAWTFLTLASVGAAACLFVTMILGARMLALVREREQPPAPPARVQGRRVAR